MAEIKVSKKDLDYSFNLWLRARRPPTGICGPFGPEVPLGVSKIGVCPKVYGEVPLGALLKVT